MTDEFGVQKTSSNLMSVEQQRAVQEVQAMMIIAKRFPRDVDECLLRIKKACKRVALAEKATYVYPRGGKTVSGPSIRLAEVIAQNWTNLVFGIRELSQSEGKSEVESFAWDVETNVRQVKTFAVKHQRKAKGSLKILDDPRDIYEHTANLGARRMRACVLGIVPGDIVEAAEKQCQETLKNRSDKPLEDRIRDMLDVFAELGVTKPMIELNLGHKTGAIIEQELINLGQIYNSLKDGMSKRGDWFKVDEVKIDTDLKAAILKKEPELTNPLPADDPGPWHRPNWINIRKAGFQKYYTKHRDSLPEQPADIQKEVNDKFQSFYMKPSAPQNDAQNTESSQNPSEELKTANSSKKQQLASAEGNGITADELKEEVINQIANDYTPEQVKKAQLDRGYAVGVWPSTLDGCQALLDRLKENAKM